jgi:hypothetical protein
MEQEQGAQYKRKRPSPRILKHQRGQNEKEN